MIFGCLILLLTYFSATIRSSVPPSLKELRNMLTSVETVDGETGYNRFRADSWKEGHGDGGNAVVVNVGLFIGSLSRLTPATMGFDVDMLIHLSWNDTRLAHNNTQHLAISDFEIIKRIWRPDLYFANSKKAEYHELTKPNFLMRIYPDGRIYYVLRVSGQFSCQQRLHLYPFDRQTCSIKMKSFSYGEEEIRFQWFSRNPLRRNPKINLPEMDIIRLTHKKCADHYGEQDDIEKGSETRKDTYSCLEAKIDVRRRLGYHIVQTYIPSMMIVVVSWVSFWIDPHAAPARVALSVTTLLTLTTMTSGVRMTLPKVSYAKAIDLWMGFCTAMIFAALIEYAVVNSMLQQASHLLKLEADKINMKQLGHKMCESVLNTTGIHGDLSERPKAELNFKEKKFKRNAYRLDNISKVVFPIVFFAVTVIYWLVSAVIL